MENCHIAKSKSRKRHERAMRNPIQVLKWHQKKEGRKQLKAAIMLAENCPLNGQKN